MFIHKSFNIDFEENLYVSFLNAGEKRKIEENSLNKRQNPANELFPPTFSVSSGTFPYCFDSIFSIKQSRTANKLKNIIQNGII